MRRPLWWQLTALLLLSAAVAGAQVPISSQNGQSSGSTPEAGATAAGAGEVPATSTNLTPGVTITGKALHGERSLPKLPPDEFSGCMKQKMSPFSLAQGGFEITQMAMQAAMCEHRLDWEMQAVIDACLNRTGKTALPRIIQACTESLDRNVLQGGQRFFLLADRAQAYFAYGDARRALDDYNAAIKLAPRNAELYYDRGVVFAARSDDDAALGDFDTAMTMDSKLVPALRQRAKIYEARRNFSGALADYSQAIRLQPQAASLWSDRGYVDLRQHGYESAVRDEARAIQLDPRLARAYYLRGVAFGNMGDRANAVSDIRTAVGLDPALAHYVVIQGKTVKLTLPPL